MGTLRWAVLGSIAILGGATALAHHRLEVQFDPSRILMLNGTITNVSWTNPHIQLNVAVMDSKGTSNWTFEMGSPNQELLRGIKLDTLKKGDRVAVDAYPARDGSNLGYASKVVRMGR